MANRERIKTAVYSAVDEFNRQLSTKGARIEKSLNAPLYGPSGKLESLDFVTFILEVEEKVKATFDVDITIADEDLLSKDKSPFSNIRTLIEYLEDTLEQQS